MVCRKECGRENKCGVWGPKQTKIKYREVRENACRASPKKRPTRDEAQGPRGRHHPGGDSRNTHLAWAGDHQGMWPYLEGGSLPSNQLGWSHTGISWLRWTSIPIWLESLCKDGHVKTLRYRRREHHVTNAHLRMASGGKEAERTVESHCLRLHTGSATQEL